MIQKIYEIACDWCGNAEHYHVNSFFRAEQMLAGKGGIVLRNKRHFCSESCYEQYEEAKDGNE